MPIYIRGFRMLPDGFFAMWVDIDEEHLPRSHTDRLFDLRMTMGKKALYEWNGVRDDVVREYIRELSRRYAGTERVINVERGGQGGAAMFHKDEQLGEYVSIDFLYAKGGETKGLHISL